jgi:hypothetical protein
VLVPRLVRPDADRPAGSTRSIDVPGAVLVTGGLIGIVFGLIEAATEPWSSAKVVVPLVGGAVAVLGFLAYQAVAATPLLPLRFLQERTRSVATS